MAGCSRYMNFGWGCGLEGPDISGKSYWDDTSTEQAGSQATCLGFEGQEVFSRIALGRHQD